MGRQCKCKRGYVSAYDGKCGHCRTTKEQKAHMNMLDRMPFVPVDRVLRYAGIGSRTTPIEVLVWMERIGLQLASTWTLRSGYAEGADQAFGRGAEEGNGRFEMYLPWSGFNDAPTNDDRFIVPAWTKELTDLAMRYHPSWNRCSRAAKAMHVRNGCQILGLDLKTPVDMVVCWTPGGKAGGGTGQAIRIAKANGIPVFDLANVSDQMDLCLFTEHMQQEIDTAMAQACG